jgi:hypothetical protein
MSSLDGWTMHQVEGKTYIGKPQKVSTSPEPCAFPDGPFDLSPVYELQFIPIQTPQGVGMQPALGSPFGCPSVRSLTLPRPGVWVSIGSLAVAEQRSLAQLVGHSVAAEQQARAAASGLTLAPAGTKLPPMQPHGNGGRGTGR